MTRHFVRWRKSRHSDPNGGCVEVGRAANDIIIGVRDSKGDPAVVLEFTRREWSRLLDSLR